MSDDDIEAQVRFVTKTLGLIRQLIGWTLTDAARAVGKKVPSQISDFEAARRSPSLAQILLYCRAYRVKLEDILRQYDQPAMGVSEMRKWLQSLGFGGIQVDSLPFAGSEMMKRLSVANRLTSIYPHLDGKRVLDDWK